MVDEELIKGAVTTEDVARIVGSLRVKPYDIPRACVAG
jgi:hypothetical protein